MAGKGLKESHIKSAWSPNKQVNRGGIFLFFLFELIAFLTNLALTRVC